MSFRHWLWRKRTEYRFGRPADCFRLDNPATADPRDLSIGIAENARDRVLARVGGSDVLRGDWDSLERGLSDTGGDEPVTLVIGRDGDPIVLRGEGRVLRAQREGAAAIPVRVALVHPRWQRFRNQVLNFCDAHKGAAYQKIDHPDLGRVPWFHGDERLGIIRPHVPLSSGTVLDIGANWGYWSHAFEKLGFACTAVDHNPKNAMFLRKIRRAMRRTFAFEERSVFDLPGTLRYDLVLALNIFHHFIRDAATFERLRDLLGRLEAHHMFFEPHREEELAGKECHRNMGPDEFVGFVLENSCLNESKLVGTAENGRRIYLLSR